MTSLETRFSSSAPGGRVSPDVGNGSLPLESGNPDMSEFNPFWEDDIYGKGQHLNRYPYDNVVSFVYRNYPRERARSGIRILEVGCGAGNNLWFAAREGFRVAGVDGSETAIEYARRRFAEEGLSGEFHVGDYTQLPFENERFDLAIDRAAITYANRAGAERAVAEIARVLRAGGRFFFNPYSQEHASFASGQLGDDGLSRGMDKGTLTHAVPLRFYRREDLDGLFSNDRWRILTLEHIAIRDEGSPERGVHAEWRLVAEKR